MGKLALIKKKVVLTIFTQYTTEQWHMNLANLNQDCCQDIEDFRYQYLPMQKVCDEINLHFGLCKSDTKIVLKKEFASSFARRAESGNGSCQPIHAQHQ